MSEPADAAKPPIPATVIPQLSAAAAQIAAAHAEPGPASIAAVATTRAKALDVIGKGAKIPGSESVPVYVVVMTGHFISPRGGLTGIPLTGSTLTVTLDTTTLTLMGWSLSDNDDTALLPALGPVITLKTR